MEIRLGNGDPRLDPDRIEQGVEKECPMARGLFVTIRPAAVWNKRWKERVREENRRALERMKDGDEGQKPGDHYDDPAFIVDTLVVSMRGLYDGEGNEIPYTPEVGVRVLSDPRHEDIKEWVALQARKYGDYYEQEVRADEGN